MNEKMRTRGKTALKAVKGADMAVDVKRRLIVMSGNISKETAVGFQRALWKMQVAGLGEITVRIVRGKGGCAVSAMMIYGLLRSCFAPVRCVVERYARSGSLLVLQGAGERVMRKNAHLKFHWAEAYFRDDVPRDIREVGELYAYLVGLNEKLYEAARERSGLPMGSVRDFFARGAVLSAKEAVKFSLADGIE